MSLFGGESLLNKMKKIGLGGGCHWCTEGIFQSLKGVLKVDQGWIGSKGTASELSEAVLVYFDPERIDVSVLIDIHLHTHSSTANHNLRSKYRSAIYTFDENQAAEAKSILKGLQANFDQPLVTQVLPFRCFNLNVETQLNYFYSRPNAPFCKRYIQPKIDQLKIQFSNHIDIKTSI